MPEPTPEPIPDPGTPPRGRRARQADVVYVAEAAPAAPPPSLRDKVVAGLAVLAISGLIAAAAYYGERDRSPSPGPGPAPIPGPEDGGDLVVDPLVERPVVFASGPDLALSGPDTSPAGSDAFLEVTAPAGFDLRVRTRPIGAAMLWLLYDSDRAPRMVRVRPQQTGQLRVDLLVFKAGDEPEWGVATHEIRVSSPAPPPGPGPEPPPGPGPVDPAPDDGYAGYAGWAKMQFVRGNRQITPPEAKLVASAFRDAARRGTSGEFDSSANRANATLQAASAAMKQSLGDRHAIWRDLFLTPFAQRIADQMKTGELVLDPAGGLDVDELERIMVAVATALEGVN